MSRRHGEWDVRTWGTAHPQGLVALVGDGLPVRLDDDDADVRNVLDTMTPIQREVLATRLQCWADTVAAYNDAVRVRPGDPS